MAGFGRRRGGASKAERRRQTERDKLDATPPWQVVERSAVAATTGPWDLADAPGDDERDRIDLGSLRLPQVEGIDVAADPGPDGQIATVRMVRAGTQLQVGVFAAPRDEGIWDEVREELASSLREGGGTAEEIDGEHFGTELRGSLVGARGTKPTPVRFLGVDGPRWFLRAMLVGPGVSDDDAAAPLLEAFRDTVVVRGREPLPVRDPVPLQPPRTRRHGEDDADGGSGDDGDAAP